MQSRNSPTIYLIIFSILALLGTSMLSSCSVGCDVKKYNETVQPYLQQWDDAANLANSTPRMALAPQIEKLQGIRRDVAALEIQSCLQDEHQLLIQAMDYEIDGFIAFLGQKPDATVNQDFDLSQQYLKKWSDALANQ